ncbi:MAG: tail fiber domain-containing protein [Alphaproteobacteria bacterium]|nr:tail fiber domain-containing protein [Alphaproteobacteria bacterium]MBV8549326.1 tail fiber domain-containing protein [Alphaproteobacteria bacterium]
MKLMQHFRSGLRKKQGGYTLVELAIVLAVAGLLFTGLWRLLSGGNLQLKDAATATQQQQLISAIKGYLLSSNGTSFIQLAGSAGTWQLKLPTNAAGTANCVTEVAGYNETGLCNYLPAGFSATTTNPYGQTYLVYGKNDANSPPVGFAFLIMTTGGETITDASGGRVSSQVGADGGFIYSNNVCGNAPSVFAWACGAYGAWSELVTDFGVAAPAAGGFVASRTYYSPDQDANQPWLARTLLNNNIGYNTMSTNLFLGGQTMYMANSTGATAGGGTISMQGGSMTDAVTDATGAQINITHSSTGNTTNPRPQISVASGCSQTSPGAPASCQYSINVTGDMNVSSLINANYVYAQNLYAQSFIYQSSDQRLKKDVTTIEDGLDNVMRIRPVNYTLKVNDKKSMGVIAQELQQIYPDAVTVSDGNGMLAVNYSSLIAPLIASVQELKHENDALKARIQALETKTGR